MKIAVINFSGNVGKTTIASHLLAPRMPQARLISIESVNTDASANGIDVERLRARKFGELQDKLMTLDEAIVDIGSSNVEETLKLMQQYAGSHEEFDAFLVPVVKDAKQQGDSVNTIRALQVIGVPPAKIRVLFNRLDVDEKVDEEFPALFGLAASEKSFTLNPRAVIYENEVFARLKDLGRSLGDVATDPVDYRAKLRTLSDPDERDACVAMVAVKRLAVTARSNLDNAYAALFAS